VSPAVRTAVGGRVAPGFELVRDAFADDLERRGDGGAAFAAVVDGRPVVDVWGGMADDRAGTPWEAGTAAVLFSGSKGLVATLLLLMVERGRLALDAPVARWWPEFAAAGKGAITVAQLSAHAAGLPGAEPPPAADDLAEPERMAARLAAQAPMLPPGRPSYHALTYGWLAGELLRRADGREPGRLVAEELAAPLGGLDLRLGLPPDDPLAGRLARLRTAPGYRLAAFAGERPDPRLAAVFGDPPLAGEAWNEPRLLAVPVPAVNAVATARAMAAVYGALVGGPRRLLAPATLALGTAAAAEGDDPLSGRPLRFGPTGFELAGTPSALGPAADAFGHTGAGGSSHGAWPSLRTGFSYLTADLRSEADDGRAAALLAALHAAVSR
jgi:CubicO group peptidase (beta-lactamase class C family)